jgi:hypothetical protein
MIKVTSVVAAARRIVDARLARYLGSLNAAP